MANAEFCDLPNITIPAMASAAQMTKLTNANIQYSLRRARPAKVAYLPTTAKYQCMEVSSLKGVKVLDARFRPEGCCGTGGAEIGRASCRERVESWVGAAC